MKNHLKTFCIFFAILYTASCGDSDSPSTPQGTTPSTSSTATASTSSSPPSAEWSTEPPSTLQIAQPLSLDATIADPDGDTLTTSWRIDSATADGFDCSSLITAQTDTTLAIRIPGNVDERCADELDVVFTVSDGSQDVTRTHRISVVPTPGRVTSFTELPNNPQPPIGGCPTWHCLNHSDTTLGRLPNGQLAVWSSTSSALPDAPPVPVVGRFVQQPDGSWQDDPNPSLDPRTLPEDHWAIARETPSVRWNPDANAWDMWFLAYRESYFEDPAIGQLRSQDPEGSQWGISDGPIYRPTPGAWDESFLTSPTVVRGSDGIWRLYYSGASFAVDNGRLRVGVLTSTDGENWSAPDNPVVFEGPQGAWDEGILDPHVQFVGGRYVMWYTGYVPPLDIEADDLIAIGVAVSEDGYTFERITEEPIIAPVPNSWNDRRVLAMEVLREEDGSLLMVGYALSKTVPHPFAPDLFPGRIGFWVSP